MVASSKWRCCCTKAARDDDEDDEIKRGADSEGRPWEPEVTTVIELFDVDDFRFSDEVVNEDPDAIEAPPILGEIE